MLNLNEKAKCFWNECVLLLYYYLMMYMDIYHIILLCYCSITTITIILLCTKMEWGGCFKICKYVKTSAQKRLRTTGVER